MESGEAKVPKCKVRFPFALRTMRTLKRVLVVSDVKVPTSVG